MRQTIIFFCNLQFIFRIISIDQNLNKTKQSQWLGYEKEHEQFYPLNIFQLKNVWFTARVSSDKLTLVFLMLIPTLHYMAQPPPLPWWAPDNQESDHLVYVSTQTPPAPVQQLTEQN